MALKRLWPRLPGVPLVVAATTAISAWTGFAAQGGAVVGEVPAGLPGLSLPPLRPELIATLLPAAFVVAMVSFMEAASSAKLISGRTRQPWDQDQELVGQGLGKLAAAFTGGLPVSASFSRSALNYANEARTGLSSHGHRRLRAASPCSGSPRCCGTCPSRCWRRSSCRPSPG